MSIEYQNILKLKSSPLKWLLVLLVSIAFVLLAVALFKNGNNSPMIWVSVIFFGLGIPLSIINILPNSNYLLLTPEGFTIRSSFRSRLFKWSDIKCFSVDQLTSPNPFVLWFGIGKVVTFEFSDTYTKQKVARAIAEGLAGHESALEGAYGMKFQDLCNLMNEWRERYGGFLHPESIQTTPGVPV